MSFFLVKSSSIIRCLALLDHHELGFLTRKAAVIVLCFLQSSFLAVTFRAPNQTLSAPVFSLFPTLNLPTVPVSPPLPWKTKKPSSTTNPIQLHPLRPVRFFPVLPSIDLALRRPGASSNRSGVCSVVFWSGCTPGPGAASRLRSIRSHPQRGSICKVLLGWLLVFAARSARLFGGFSAI